MGLCRLGVQDFRCIANAELLVDSRCNLISGDNASGKTSLLEAVFFLGRGRSFRTTRYDGLFRKGTSRLTVTGRLAKRRAALNPSSWREASTVPPPSPRSSSR